MTKHKRRLIPIVDRRFQFKYTAIIVAVAAVVSCVLGFLLLTAYREMNAIIEVSSSIGESLDASDAQRVFYIVCAFLVGEVVILGVMGLLITHRVAGPLFVFQRHLNTLRDGRYPTLRPLRPGDEFRDAFETFSLLISELKARDKQEMKTLRETIAGSQAGTLTSEQLDALRSMIESRMERLNDGK